MNNTLLIAGGLLVAIFAALFAGPHFVDWTGYRGVFEEEASKVMGRDVRVGGAVNLRLLPVPYVSFEKVRLSDTAAQTGEPFLRVENFAMKLSAGALLRGVIEANEIELTKPVLSLSLDGEGGGNWSSFSFKPGSLPFVPKDVTLHSVRISDGSISIHSPSGDRLHRIDAIAGELSADSLQGPFRYKGTAAWSGIGHDVRLATEKPQADGAVRFKGGVRAATGLAMTVDGTVVNVSTKPSIVADVTATLASDVDPQMPAKASAEPPTPAADLKARLTADATIARLDDIVFTLESGAEPQIVTGAASANFADKPRADINLTSKWLDLDRLTERVGLVGRVIDWATSAGDASEHVVPAHVLLNLDQVRFGGEAAGNVVIDVERRRTGGYVVNTVRAGLPGGSRFEISGELETKHQTPAFAGHGVIRGVNLARLIAWAEKSGRRIDVAADGPFLLSGDISASSAGFAIKEARGEIGGRPFRGELVVADGATRSVRLKIESDEVDTAVMFPNEAQALFENLVRSVGLGGPVAPAGPQTTPDKREDISLSLVTRRLRHAGATYRDVDARVSFEGGDLVIPRARLTSASGQTIEVAGRIASPGIKAKGALTFDLAGDAAIILGDLSRAGVPMPSRATTELPHRLAVAGVLRVGERRPGSADLSFAGTSGAAAVSGSAELDGGLAEWRTHPARVTYSSAAVSLDTLAQVFGNAASLPVSSSPTAKVLLSFDGIPETDAVVYAEVNGNGLKIVSHGRAMLPANRPANFTGNVSVAARSARDVLAAVGLPAPGGTTGVPLTGKFDVKSADQSWRIATRRMTAGSSVIDGKIELARAPAGLRVTGEIAVDQITAGGLFAVLTGDGAQPLTTGATSANPPRAPVWTPTPFDLAPYRAAEGDVQVKFRRFVLEPGLQVHDGGFDFKMTPTTVSLANLSGSAAGGEVNFSAAFSRTPGAIDASATLDVKGVDLALLNAQARGRASLKLAIAGRAQSLSAMMSAVNGNGQLDLEAVAHPGPSADAVTGIADAVLLGKLPINDPAATRDAWMSKFALALAEPGTRSVPIQVSDGSAKFDVFDVASAGGHATVAATADLPSLAFDVQWRVRSDDAVTVPLPAASNEPPAPVLARAPLPAVDVIYTGRLASLDQMSVSISDGEMLREVAVRQIERNAEELERLRLRDEERGRRDAERRKAIDDERKLVVPAAPEALPQIFPEALDPPLPDALPGNAPDAAAAGTALPTDATADGATPVNGDSPADGKPVRQSRPYRSPGRSDKDSRRTTQDEVMRALRGGF